MADRTTALEAWLGTVVEKGAPHKLRDGGPAAVSIVGKAARAIVEEDGGHASPKACAPGGEWGQAKQLARKFSEAAYERWPITTNPTGAEATAAVEILLYCAACCDKSSKRGAYIQRILRLPQAQQQQLMGAMKAQMAAEREAQSGQRKPLDAGTGGVPGAGPTSMWRPGAGGSRARRACRGAPSRVACRRPASPRPPRGARARARLTGRRARPSASARQPPRARQSKRRAPRRAATQQARRDPGRRTRRAERTERERALRPRLACCGARAARPVRATTQRPRREGGREPRARRR